MAIYVEIIYNLEFPFREFYIMSEERYDNLFSSSYPNMQVTVVNNENKKKCIDQYLEQFGNLIDLLDLLEEIEDSDSGSSSSSSASIELSDEEIVESQSIYQIIKLALKDKSDDAKELILESPYLVIDDAEIHDLVLDLIEDPVFCKQLIEKLGDRKQEFLNDNPDGTLLNYLLNRGVTDVDLCKYLIQEGSDLHAPDQNGSSVLLKIGMNEDLTETITENLSIPKVSVVKNELTEESELLKKLQLYYKNL